jgi:hypothetical protein
MSERSAEVDFRAQQPLTKRTAVLRNEKSITFYDSAFRIVPQLMAMHSRSERKDPSCGPQLHPIMWGSAAMELRE